MSLVSEVYRFVGANLGRSAPLGAARRSELRVAVGLFPLVFRDASRPPQAALNCSGSSSLGYALHRAECDVGVIRGLSSWREPWRFREATLEPRTDEDSCGVCADAWVLSPAFDECVSGQSLPRGRHCHPQPLRQVPRRVLEVPDAVL